MKKYIAIIIFILLIALVFYSYFILGNQMRSSRGLVMGAKYVANLYADYSVVGKNCQGEDSDNNGYITCNFRLKNNGDASEKSISLQCPTFIKSFLSTSCKESGMIINQN